MKATCNSRGQYTSPHLKKKNHLIEKAFIFCPPLQLESCSQVSDVPWALWPEHLAKSLRGLWVAPAGDPPVGPPPPSTVRQPSREALGPVLTWWQPIARALLFQGTDGPRTPLSPSFPPVESQYGRLPFPWGYWSVRALGRLRNALILWW